MAPKSTWQDTMGRLMEIARRIDEHLAEAFPGITRRGGITIDANGRSAALEVKIVLPDEPAETVDDPASTDDLPPGVPMEMMSIIDALTPRTPRPHLPPGNQSLAEFLRSTFPVIYMQETERANVTLDDLGVGSVPRGSFPRACQRDPKPGLKKPVPFGKYYLLERIAIGGMSEVFRAKTYGVEAFEKTMVIKRILPNIAEDEELIQMFIDEAKIAVQLNHANIAQVYDLGKINDSYFIALEYVSGMDLRDILDGQQRQETPLPIPLACHIVGQVCEALDYAHKRKDSGGREWGIVHRDVSPEKILVSFNGDVKLTGFGIAKAADMVSRTQAILLKGKFGYMSPEQIRGLPIDRRSDIFSLGIVLYELLTNERLFVGESDFATLEKVKNVDIQLPTHYNSAIPPELEEIVMKALSRDIGERYQTAADFHEAIMKFLVKNEIEV